MTQIKEISAAVGMWRLEILDEVFVELKAVLYFALVDREADERNTVPWSEVLPVCSGDSPLMHLMSAEGRLHQMLAVNGGRPIQSHYEVYPARSFEDALAATSGFFDFKDWNWRCGCDWDTESGVMGRLEHDLECSDRPRPPASVVASFTHHLTVVSD